MTYKYVHRNCKHVINTVFGIMGSARLNDKDFFLSNIDDFYKSKKGGG